MEKSNVVFSQKKYFYSLLMIKMTNKLGGVIMKGTAVSTWLKTCRKLYGNDVVDRAMINAGML